MTYFMSPAPNHWRRQLRGPRPRKPHARGPNAKPNPSQPNFPPILASCEMLRDDILARYILSRDRIGRVRQVTIGLKLASSTAARTLRPRCTGMSLVAPN